MSGPATEPRDAWLSAHVAHQLADLRRVRELYEAILAHDDGPARRLREALLVMELYPNTHCDENRAAQHVAAELIAAQAFARAMRDWNTTTARSELDTPPLAGFIQKETSCALH